MPDSLYVAVSEYQVPLAEIDRQLASMRAADAIDHICGDEAIRRVRHHQRRVPYETLQRATPDPSNRLRLIPTLLVDL